MSRSFEEARRRIEAAGGLRETPTPDALDAMEFLASPGASLDKVPEERLERWIEAVGGVREFCRLRATSRLEHAIRVVKAKLREQVEARRPVAVVQRHAEYLAIAADALGYPSGRPLAPNAEVDSVDALAVAHQQLIREIALDRRLARLRSTATGQAAISTFRISDSTTTELADAEPEWVLNREIVLEEEIAVADPDGARMFRWNEFAGAGPDQITRLLNQSGRSPSATTNGVASTIHRIRAYCYGEAAH